MLSTASWTTGPHNWLEGARVQPRDRGQGSFANLSPRCQTVPCIAAVKL